MGFVSLPKERFVMLRLNLKMLCYVWAAACGPWAIGQNCFIDAGATCEDQIGLEFLFACNATPCLYEHVMEGENRKVQNGFYVLNYDCPGEHIEGVVQDDETYDCMVDNDDGIYGGIAPVETVQ